MSISLKVATKGEVSVMRIEKQFVAGVTIALGFLASTACGGEAPLQEDDGATALSAPLELLDCGHADFEWGDETFSEDRLYSVNELSERLLKNPEARSRLGLSKVSTCAEAYEATNILREVDFEGGETGVDENRYLPEVESEEKILNPAGNGNRPGTLEVVVGSDVCTGSLLGWGTAVTAAHCTDTVLNPAQTTDGLVDTSVRVSLWRNNAWVCIWGSNTSGDGRCDAGSTATVIMHGPYTGDGNTDSDISIIMLASGSTWSSVSTSDFLRVYTGSFNSFPNYQINGEGPNSDSGSGSGTMRWGSFGNDVFGTYAYYAVARTPRTCSGDSGGPAIVDNSGFANMIGHHSKSSHPTTSCADDGTNQYGMRMNQKIGWVEGYMSSRRSESCSSFSGTLGNYERCF